MGCEVTAISRTASKEVEARGFGATRFLISEDADALKEAASSFDMILNTVSGTEPLDKYFALLKPRGKLVCVGLPEKEQKTQMFLHSAVLTERELLGSYLGPYKDYGEMLAFAGRHGIKPQIEQFPMGDINLALRRVRQNSARYRVVLTL